MGKKWGLTNCCYGFGVMENVIVSTKPAHAQSLLCTQHIGRTGDGRVGKWKNVGGRRGRRWLLLDVIPRLRPQTASSSRIGTCLPKNLIQSPLNALKKSSFTTYVCRSRFSGSEQDVTYLTDEDFQRGLSLTPGKPMVFCDPSTILLCGLEM